MASELRKQTSTSTVILSPDTADKPDLTPHSSARASASRPNTPRLRRLRSSGSGVPYSSNASLSMTKDGSSDCAVLKELEAGDSIDVIVAKMSFLKSGVAARAALTLKGSEADNTPEEDKGGDSSHDTSSIPATDEETEEDMDCAAKEDFCEVSMVTHASAISEAVTEAAEPDEIVSETAEPEAGSSTTPVDLGYELESSHDKLTGAGNPLTSGSTSDTTPQTSTDDTPMICDDDTAPTSSEDDTASDPAVDAPTPPGGPLEIVFSFDTTGSMSQVLEQVQGRLNDMIQRLQADIPGIRVAILAHGDYCDEAHFYVTRHQDFTNDVTTLCNFVTETSGTGGGDPEECYELALNKIRTELSWSEGSQRALVMIGDDVPHEPDYPLNAHHIDWRNELRGLKDMGVRVYSVQCLSREKCRHFWEGMATFTEGRHLNLDEFSNVFDLIMAICYREKGAEFFEMYEAEVRAREGPAINTDLDKILGALRNKPSDTPDAADATMDTSSAPAPGPSRSESASSKSKTPRAGIKVSTKMTDREKRLRIAKPKPSKFQKQKNTVVGRKTAEKAAKVAAEATPKTSRATNPKKEAVTLVTKTTGKKAGGVTKTTVKKATTVTKTTPKKTKGRNVRRPVKRVLRESSKNASSLCLHYRGWRCQLQFDDWSLAVAPSHSDDDTGVWLDQASAHPGLRRTDIYRGQLDSPAVYEIAIQAKNSHHKTPVYYRTCQGDNTSRSWWHAFVARNQKIRSRVDRVVSGGGRVFVRRAVFRNVENKPWRGVDVTKRCTADRIRHVMLKKYDYMWSRQSSRGVRAGNK